jgi:hypothetical protein
MKPVAAIMEWYGPYAKDDARTASFDYEDGIYLAKSGRTTAEPACRTLGLPRSYLRA